VPQFGRWHSKLRIATVAAGTPITFEIENILFKVVGLVLALVIEEDGH
jgi:hypothetical protein